MTTGSRARSTARPGTSRSATCKSPSPYPTCKHRLTSNHQRIHSFPCWCNTTLPWREPMHLYNARSYRTRVESQVEHHSRSGPTLCKCCVTLLTHSLRRQVTQYYVDLNLLLCQKLNGKLFMVIPPFITPNNLMNYVPLSIGSNLSSGVFSSCVIVLS